MTTTKPARQRPGTPAPAKPAAPTYKRLDSEAYAALIDTERARHDLHLDVDAIIDALPRATLDRDSIGFRADCRYESNGGGLAVTVNAAGEEESQLNGVEAASQKRAVDTATDWLAEQKEARSALVVAARSARFKWPDPPKPGTQMGGVTVGKRTTSLEECGLCHEPLVGGKDGPIRRIDGQAFCAKKCWFTVKRQREVKAS